MFLGFCCPSTASSKTCDPACHADLGCVGDCAARGHPPDGSRADGRVHVQARRPARRVRPTHAAHGIDGGGSSAPVSAYSSHARVRAEMCDVRIIQIQFKIGYACFSVFCILSVSASGSVQVIWLILRFQCSLRLFRIGVRRPRGCGRYKTGSLYATRECAVRTCSRITIFLMHILVSVRCPRPSWPYNSFGLGGATTGRLSSCLCPKPKAGKTMILVRIV